MIITTTQSIEGRQIIEYKGIVFGEVVTGVNFIKDFAAGMRNFFGGRSGSYEEELLAARNPPQRLGRNGTACSGPGSKRCSRSRCGL